MLNFKPNEASVFHRISSLRSRAFNGYSYDYLGGRSKPREQLEIEVFHNTGLT